MFDEVAIKTDSIYGLKVNNKPIYDAISRILDIFLSLAALVIGLPLFIIAAIAIKIEDRGPILYRQTRLGIDGKTFTIYKMRSMKIDAEEKSARWAKAEDGRVTKVGKFIRKTRIDEIPQLYNILLGQMKIVGPRPERPELAKEFYKELPEFANRLTVKPGLTGLAQVSGGYNLTPAEKLVLDIDYIENRGFLLDLMIILRTMGVVISGYGAR